MPKRTAQMITDLTFDLSSTIQRGSGNLLLSISRCVCVCVCVCAGFKGAWCLQVSKLKQASKKLQQRDHSEVKGQSKGSKDGSDDPITDLTDNSDQFVTAFPHRQLYPTLSDSETTPVSPSKKGVEGVPVNVVLSSYKHGLERGLLLGASPQPTTSLEQVISQDVASFAATLKDTPLPSAPPLSALGKRSRPSRANPPRPKKEKLSPSLLGLGGSAESAKKHVRSSSLTSGLTSLLRKNSPAGKRKKSWNPFGF